MGARFETYSIEGLSDLVKQYGQPQFRAQQLFEWVYGKGVTDYDAMTNLPAALRETLASDVPLSMPTVVEKRVSADGTRKYVLELSDGACVEAVGIPSRDENERCAARRLTVCFSTQVGCAMGCTFCATGKEGFTRNLEPGEMAWQVLAVERDFDMRVSNAVAMGQGEPFLNYVNLLAALRILNHPKGPCIGARHITVSTCGLVDGIRSFGKEPEQFTLAISLHSARQEVRDRLMPGVSYTSLSELKDALFDYEGSSGRRVSLEYLLIDGTNDRPEDLAALVSFCRDLSCHVNLLAINEVSGSAYRPSPSACAHLWKQKLTEAHIQASVRDSRGSDIEAACGQLKNSRMPAAGA